MTTIVGISADGGLKAEPSGHYVSITCYDFTGAKDGLIQMWTGSIEEAQRLSDILNTWKPVHDVSQERSG